MEKTEVCSNCSAEHLAAELIEFSGERLCPICLERETIIRSHCGRRIWNDDNVGNENMPLCGECHDNHYVECDHCGRIIYRD